ncbi:MAG TPA: hypothetical protein VF898_05465 [Chloroflexota bacterium]
MRGAVHIESRRVAKPHEGTTIFGGTHLIFAMNSEPFGPSVPLSGSTKLNRPVNDLDSSDLTFAAFDRCLIYPHDGRRRLGGHSEKVVSSSANAKEEKQYAQSNEHTVRTRSCHLSSQRLVAPSISKAVDSVNVP